MQSLDNYLIYWSSNLLFIKKKVHLQKKDFIYYLSKNITKSRWSDFIPVTNYFPIIFIFFAMCFQQINNPPFF